MDEKNDAGWMRLALEEACKGLGKTSPNPAVGCVIVRDGKVIATGWHRGAGGPHAEIEALNNLKNPEDARGADLYVTLEPCSTHGKTPPCTEAIIRAGIRTVVYGATDPNPAHCGRADAILRAAGITTRSGVLAEECAALNRAWNHWIVTKRPWVLCKAALSLDGRISSLPEQRWISCLESRRDAMRLRAETDAILVGGGTLRADNPALTVRGIDGARQPLRVIWSRSVCEGDPAFQVFTDELRDRTIVLRCSSFEEVLDELGRRDVVHLLVEGGGRVHGEIFGKRLANEVVFYYAPILLGGPVAAIGGTGVRIQDALRLKNVEYSRIGTDLRLRGLIFP
jgi:diaminohydroxyphosphoribosylaminopyrimidine deaminase/5-amino-6-(5-phosphoribosylamino)uracil reductase